MWKPLGAIIKGILFLLGLVGLVTLPEDVQEWAKLMGPLTDYVPLDRVEFALYAAIIVFGLWILLPVATPFLVEIQRFFKQHDRRRLNTKPPYETDQQPEIRQNRRFPKVDLDEWRDTDPLTLWQAGCLWNAIKPQYPVTFDNPAYGRFSMLLRAAEHGDLGLIKKEPTPEFAHSQVTRRELARYAIQKGELPEFLTDVILNEKIENRKQDKEKVAEVLSGFLFSADEIIKRSIDNDAGLNKWKQDYQEWRAQVISFMRVNISSTSAYHFSNPGMIVVRRFDVAYNDDHNSLLNSLVADRENLRHLHALEG